jgi:5S rRNA maturation endonuclease (ribonuclease M5)
MNVLDAAAEYYHKNITEKELKYLLEDRGFGYVSGIENFMKEEKIGGTNGLLYEHLRNDFHEVKLIESRLVSDRRGILSDTVKEETVSFPRRGENNEIINIYFRNLFDGNKFTKHFRTGLMNIESRNYLLSKIPYGEKFLLLEGDINYFTAKALNIPALDVNFAGLTKYEIETMKENNLKPIFYTDLDPAGERLTNHIGSVLEKNHINVKRIELEFDMNKLLVTHKENAFEFIQEKMQKAPHYLPALF